MRAFEPINRGYDSVFRSRELSIGVVVPIENYATHNVPSMQHHLRRVQLVDQLGFKALWVRDVPFNVPSFGDAGQTFDPFTYLGFLSGHTSDITLGVASIALPLHHPAHVAKSSATIDHLADGRFILGVASGDRPTEYPAMGIDFEKRGEMFRQSFSYLRAVQNGFPVHESSMYGSLDGRVDLLPKANGHKIPMLVTGNSRQSLEWIAEHGDGWMYYPRNAFMQSHNIEQWRGAIPDSQEYDKPFMQPLYVDLQNDPDFLPQPIHLGYRAGTNYLIEYFQSLKAMGVNHIAINLRFNGNEIEKTLERLATDVLPHFHKT